MDSIHCCASYFRTNSFYSVQHSVVSDRCQCAWDVFAEAERFFTYFGREKFLVEVIKLRTNMLPSTELDKVLTDNSENDNLIFLLCQMHFVDITKHYRMNPN